MSHILHILHTPVSASAAMGVGAAGLIAGATLAVLVVREQLAKARRLMKIDIRYKAAADDAYAKMRALMDPTCAVPVVQLFPPTPVEQIREVVAAAVERLTWRTGAQTPTEWADGELPAILARLAEQEEPVPANPYVRPEPRQPVVSRARLRNPDAVLPARQRVWSPQLARRLGGPIPVPEAFPSLVSVPAQRRPTPLAVARRLAQLPDETRQWRVRVAA